MPFLTKIGANYVHVSNFGRCQGRRTGWGGNSIQLINIGMVGDKSSKELRRKMGGGGGGGGRVVDNNILTILCNWLDKQMIL